MQQEDFEKYQQIAEEIVDYSRNALFVHLRFMNLALFALEHICSDEVECLQTDGKYLAFSPSFVVERFRDNNCFVAHAYLHMVFHCVFRHMFVDNSVDIARWNLACDIATEAIVDELDLPQTHLPIVEQQQVILSLISSQVKSLTAERIYRYLQMNVDDLKVEVWAQLFYFDDHECWYQHDESQKKAQWPGDNSSGGDQSQQNEQQSGENEDSQQGGSNNDGDSSRQNHNDSSRQKLQEFWGNASKQMQMDLDRFSQQMGTQAGNLVSGLIEVNREKYDYTKFLQSFAVLGEVMKVNDDEFDYIFYTYGMSLYKNMPLIEPLEYKEVKRIKDFVIAIDTSGSTQGELVEKFLIKTYNILMAKENFFRKINIHIVQCDAGIQHIAKITNEKEFEQYIAELTVYGGGGTDFRPVFQYVDEMITQKQFTNLKGMIYFTDGYGVFPQKMPKYKTAFVFMRDQGDIPDVPPWAIKLVLDSDEIADY